MHHLQFAVKPDLIKTTRLSLFLPHELRQNHPESPPLVSSLARDPPMVAGHKASWQKAEY